MLNRRLGVKDLNSIGSLIVKALLTKIEIQGEL